MASISSNMGLAVWDLASDPYSHTELASNFNKIDQHDHTDGNGVIIGTDGINPGAITTNRLADDAVVRAKIADGAVGANQLDTAYVHPLGGVLAWWRPSGVIDVPTGWVIPTGQTLSAAQHDFAVSGSITLPDLRNAFILGAATSGTGSGHTLPPAIGVNGGSHTASLFHTHTVDSHTHTVDGHSHTVNSHAHQVSNHHHSAGSLVMDNAAVRDQKLKVDNDSSQRANTVGAGGDNGHKHTITGTTTDASPTTDSRSPGTDSIGLTTNGSTPGTNPALGLTDIRPNFVGLLYIMKVRL